MKRILALAIILVSFVLPLSSISETIEPFKLEFSGNGTDIITGVTLPKEYLRAIFTQEEKGEFEVTLMTNKENQRILEGYGLAAADAIRIEGKFDLAVEANSPWTLIIEELDLEIFFEDLSGKGDFVSDRFIATKPMIVEITGTTDDFDHFSVKFHYIENLRWTFDLLVNDLLSDGKSITVKKILKAPTGAIGFFVVNFDDGEWSIKEVK